MEHKKLPCVVGPTACGKTAFAVLLAKKYNGEVVSVDSMQIYQGMSIGTAAPSPEEMDAIPHHMIGIANPAGQWSAARFTQAADDCIQDILSRNKLPVLAGGTGLYLDAIIAGRPFAAGSAGGTVRRELQHALEAGGVGPLLEELRRVDPDSFRRLHPSDTKRILRALEVFRETGKPISQHNRESRELPQKYTPIYFGLAYRERETMREMICRRVDRMMEQGLLEEVRRLAAAVPPDATAMQAIGYKELLPALAGEASLEDAVAEIKLRSCQYAKRQLTWLRRNPHIHWFYWEKERNFAAALQNATEILMEEGLQ